MSCPVCDRAEVEIHHEYRSDCISCRARDISTRPEFAESYSRQVITTPYRQLLAAVPHPQGFLALHRDAKAWFERLAALRDSR